MAVKKKEAKIEVAEIKEVETPMEVAEDKLEVNSAPVNESKKPEDKFKIRMRVNHRCTIANEFYDLKEGCVYTVTANVKRILTEAGLLAPL